MDIKTDNTLSTEMHARISEAFVNHRDLPKVFCKSIFCSAEIPDDLSLSEDISLYIFAKDPVQHLPIIPKNVPSDYVNILTVIADCSLLFQAHFCEKISSFLHTFGYLNDTQKKAYHLSLHEGLINAIEYGCLDMKGEKANLINQTDWFENYRTCIESRLKESAYAHRPIFIQVFLQEGHIVTTLKDPGNGFDKEDYIEEKEKNKLKSHGMGISIIDGLADNYAYTDGGKKLEIYFKAPFADHKTHTITDDFSLKEIREQAHILVVDDQRSNRELVKLYLRTAGYKNVHEAENGSDALSLLKRQSIDLIALDIVMPEMDGFTLYRKIKQIDDLKHTPILFLTGLGDPESKIRGYRLGAVDYVNKPIHHNELVARVDTHIYSGKMMKVLQDYSSRMKKDLDRAAAIQNRLLPSKQDLDILRLKHDLDIEHVYQACDELAGDYWNITDLGHNKIAITLADFTGHGVASSLNTIRLHSLFQEYAHEMENPKTFLKAINQKIYQQTDPETFLTFTYGILDTQTGSFSYIGCGSPPIAILPQSEEEPPFTLDCSGIPLGLLPSDALEIKEKCAIIREGDFMIFYSDALIETAHTPHKKMWLEDGLKDVLLDIQKKHVLPNLESLMKRFNKTAELPLKDDLTLLMIKRAAGKSETQVINTLSNYSQEITVENKVK